MGWERYFVHGFFTGEEFNLIEEKFATRDRLDHEQRSSAEARIAVLESDLARVALLARALADACIAKGVLTREELMHQVLEADLADGKQDEKLQAKVVMPGESKEADPEPAQSLEAKKGRMKRKKPYP